MSSSNWWANKLGNNNPGPRPSTPPVSAPPRQQVTVTSQQAHGMPVEYDAERDALTSKAQSARQTDQCPECMSGNFFAAPGSQYRRCYDCGYPVMQSGSGPTMPSSSTGGAATPAKQVQGAGYNPQNIVGRIE
jgi:hypothetical protein